MSRTLIHDRVDLSRKGENPTVIAHLPAGWAVIGDVQFLRGYCVLLPDPVVESLDALPLARRASIRRKTGRCSTRSATRSSAFTRRRA